MPSVTGSHVAAGVAATLAGIPVAVAGFLRLKYGPTVYEDLAKYRRYRAKMERMNKLRARKLKMIDVFEEHARDRPDKAAVLYRDEVHTYGDLDVHANRLARFIRRSPAAACRETVAIFMLNEPSFVISWLAFAKLGLRVALLNYDLKGEGLLHCIRCCFVKAIACGKDTRLMKSLEAVGPQLAALGVTVLVVGTDLDQCRAPDGMTRVDINKLNESSEPLPRSLRDAQHCDDDAIYIFTSGTTGLPKPVKLSHHRMLSFSYFLEETGLTEDDVVYTTLPLYHSNAFFACFLNTVRPGGTVALSTFSVRRFWDEVRQYRATVIQYVGEIFRYLLAQPPRPDDGQYDHHVRYALGHGLRPDIWETFQRRFNIGRIYEVYGSTEGTFTTINMDNKLGSCGRYGGIFRALTDIIAIVQCDPETSKVVRGPDGRCIFLPAGETGLMLLRITDRHPFCGYLADRETNEKKLVRDVKEQGDLFFNTGDLMLLDKEGYLYFKERLGDTFRWKSMNIATTEVAHIVNQYPGIQEANVYGVNVPGHEGRAGMASIVFKKNQQLHPKSFYDHVVKSLPLYACPKFLRIMDEMHVTGTFKHKKTDLAREGFDLNVVSDPLFFMDTEMKTYTPLDGDALRKIVIGQAKL